VGGLNAVRFVVVMLIAACSATRDAPVRPTLPTDELVDALALPDGGILARTARGSVVRFDAALHRTAEVRPPAKIVAIATDEDRGFAGLADGSIGELDLVTLALRPIASVAGELRWISVRGQELVVFLDPPGDGDLAIEVRRLDTLGTRAIAIPHGGSRAMLTRSAWSWSRDGDTVWFGVDAGEWGGAVGKVDLATGTVTMFAHRDPVLGFVTVGGRTWIHGGTVHDGSTRGYVAELVAGESKDAWSASSRRRRKVTQGPPPRPVVKLIPDGPGSFLALVWERLYRVDATFTAWTPIASIHAREHAGRPDAMGNYPATTAMIRIGERIVFATSRDGLFELHGSTIEPVR